MGLDLRRSENLGQCLCFAGSDGGDLALDFVFPSEKIAESEFIQDLIKVGGKRRPDGSNRTAFQMGTLSLMPTVFLAKVFRGASGSPTFIQGGENSGDGKGGGRHGKQKPSLGTSNGADQARAFQEMEDLADVLYRDSFFFRDFGGRKGALLVRSGKLNGATDSVFFEGGDMH